MEEWLPRYRGAALVLVLAAAFTSGLNVHLGAFPRGLATLSFASAVTLWCALDARMHAKTFLHSFGWQLMWLWPIGIAVYLVWTRRARGLVTYVLLGAACFAAAGVGLVFATALD